MKPLCFVLMPFGRKTDAAGRVTNFDGVYQKIIAPAVSAAGLDPIRADEEKVGGTIHKPMFERLMLCPYAIADITGANPNVYYELGIRHALRPRSTVILFTEGTTLPFDIAPLRGIPYRTDAGGEPVAAESSVAVIAERLREARGKPHDDSPLFQLVEHMPRHEVDHTRTEVFREIVAKSNEFKRRLDAALQKGEAARSAVAEIAADPYFANLHEAEAGVVVELFLSMRDVKAHADMVALYERMPRPLQQTRMLREQYAFALNREQRSEEAEKVLRDVLKEFGPSSETSGLLGRVYKDRWDRAKAAGHEVEARGLLKSAIAAYLAGFETDWRDTFPGVNAVTLMEFLDKPSPVQAEILPVVRYAASQRAKAHGDYWDHATLMELAVLARDSGEAHERAADALAVKGVRSWQLETTERNLRLIREARERRGEDVGWLKELETTLAEKRRRMDTGQPGS